MAVTSSTNSEEMVSLLQLAISPLLFLFANFFLLAYWPGLLDIEPACLNVTTPMPFTGPLEPNNLLDQYEPILKGSLQGPESLAVLQGVMYTGLQNGWIVRITKDGTVEQVTTIGIPDCKPWEEEKCGRPLGMRFDKNRTLNVVDAYHGLYKVNVDTGSVKTVYDMSWPVNGKPVKMINDFDMIGRTGDFYFSETSTTFGMKEGLYMFMESAPNGRIIHHNYHTNVSRVLVDGLAMPNGVQLSGRKEHLLFSEMGRNRVMKYHLRGKKEGKLEVFIDNLPGIPDNIRTNGQGGYWLPLYMAFPPGQTDLTNVLKPYPTVRKVFARIISIIRSVILFVDRFCPSPKLKTIAAQITGLTFFAPLMKPYGLILELNSKGEILRSLHSPEGKLGFISEVYPLGDALYLASPTNDFIAKLTQ